MAIETESLDQLMEQASTALAHMDYLQCEDLCLEALEAARQKKDWGYYGRIVLPLQEARRNRRIIAAGGVIRYGSATLQGPIESWIDRLSPGCIVLTNPHGAEDAREVSHLFNSKRRYGLVLLANNTADQQRWKIQAFTGPQAACEIDAPNSGLLDQWLDPVGQSDPVQGRSDWFLDAYEALGDAALSQVTAPRGDPARLGEIEQCLLATPDHEILHQELAAAAAAIR